MVSLLKVFKPLLFLRSQFYYFKKEEQKKLERNLFGINFPNPVGLAAGFDKNAELIDQMSQIGFGFVEIGTVTPVPQRGELRARIQPRVLGDGARGVGRNHVGEETFGVRAAAIEPPGQRPGVRGQLHDVHLEAPGSS